MSDEDRRVMLIETEMSAHRRALAMLADGKFVIDIKPELALIDKPDEPLFPPMNRAERRAMLSGRRNRK